MLTGALGGGGGAPDTLRGVFHAGLRTQTPLDRGAEHAARPHLKALTENTQADTTEPFRFAFPDLDGRLVTERDPRFAGKVVVVDVFGTWCPTCHDAAPELVSALPEVSGARDWRSWDWPTRSRATPRWTGARCGATGRSSGSPFTLLLAGINDTEAAAATLPQLQGFTSFPTTIFLGRDGKVRRIHAGFYGPATGAQHAKQVQGLGGRGGETAAGKAVKQLKREGWKRRHEEPSTSPSRFTLQLFTLFLPSPSSPPDPPAVRSILRPARGPARRRAASTSPPRRPRTWCGRSGRPRVRRSRSGSWRW